MPYSAAEWRLKMFRKIKKCLTAFIAAALMLSTAAGCTVGTSTAEVITVGDFQLKAGVYIYYQNTAVEEAKSLALKDNAELDTEDTDALEACVIEDKKFLDWVYDKTIVSCAEHIAVIQKFDELGLELAQEDIDLVNDYAESVYAEETNEYTDNGIGEESFKEILINTYKASEVFNAIYGEGGSANVQESELKEHYIENNARVRYVMLDLHDTEGNDLDEAGKKEIRNLANTYLNKVKAAKDETEILEKFNEVSDEYAEYKEEKAAEAAGETEEATTEAVTTAAETTTTTTTDIHANEVLIAAVTTDEETKEEDLTYSPSKEFYDWAYGASTKFNTPEVIEDENAVYVAVKLDIEERMTEEDLWNESNVESVRFALFSDALQENLDEWVAALEMTINQKAIDRYGPFDYKIEETTAPSNMVGY